MLLTVVFVDRYSSLNLKIVSHKFYPPEFAKSQFNCACCSVYSAQAWYIVAGRQGNWRNDGAYPQPQSIAKPDGGTHHFGIEPFFKTQDSNRVSMAVGEGLKHFQKEMMIFCAMICTYPFVFIVVTSVSGRTNE